MNEIFGVPMTSIMIVLVVLLAICLLVVAWVALRRPVVFKLGVRNIPRRRAQTILIVIGLMLSTLIIAAALGTGDTIDYSATAATYDSLGEADEFLVYSKADDGEANINRSLEQELPQSVVGEIEAAFAETDLIDGVMPVLLEQVPAILLDQNNQPSQAEPETILVGIDPARTAQFGGLKSVDGDEIDFAALPADGVVISEDMADELGATAGNTLLVYYNNQPFQLTIAAVAEDSPLSGKVDPNTPGMAIPLARMQEMAGKQGQISLVAISNRGGVRDGVELTDEVTTRLEQLFTNQPYGVDKFKERSIEQANLFASIFTTFFLVFGLFSIAVGILLIVLIFTMLAAERRSEMGMTRAVGAQRRQLIQQFISEGTAYAILAGLVGAALGVLAAVAIGYAVRPLLSDFLTIQPHVTPRSMVVAYCLGVVITFIAVVGSSWKISRLNIVAAVRDIPDVSSSTRKKRTIAWGIVLVILGALGTMAGLSSNNAFSFYGGVSLLPFGVALILRFFGVPPRPIFSIVGIYILVLWLLPDSTTRSLFGELNGDIEMFFLSGIFMVTGATILIVQNLDVLLGLVTRLGGLFRSRLPAVRTAVAFPGAAKGRTGMTIAMFSLIVFSLVMFATINRNFTELFTGDEANAGWDVRADTGSANPIGSTDDFLTVLNDRGVETSDVAAAGSVSVNFQVNMRRSEAQEWKYFPLVGMDERFIDESAVTFQQRATGYADDQAILEALRTRSEVVVVSTSALAAEDPFVDPNQFTLADPDGDGPEQALQSDMETFAPVSVQIEAADGSVTTAQVIGVIDSKISTLFGMFSNRSLFDQVSPVPMVTSYFLRLSDAELAEVKAKQIESTLIQNGVQGNSIKDELEEAQQQSNGFLLIFQGFMGLGLIVGIAAVGVIAFRNVVERRQQIGVLRALGYQRSLVAQSFLIETAFVVGMGVLSGTVLGLALARNLFMSDDFAGTDDVAFTVPWGIILAIIVVTIVAALLMTLVPARQASRLAPAEALRYE